MHARRSAVLLLLTAVMASATCAVADSPRVPLPFALDPAPSTYRPLPREDMLIAGATVLDGVGGRLDGADVLVRDGRIAALGPAVARPADVTVIDARGRWLTPGLIDVHTHDGTYAIPQTSSDLVYSDVSEDSDANVADTWIEHAVRPQDPAFGRALSGGVTTLQILPGSGPLFGGRTVVVKPVPAITVRAMKFPGARQGLKMSCGENPRNAAGKFPTSRMGEVAGMRRAWLQAREYERRWQDYESGRNAAPPARDLKLDTLAAVLRGEILVQLHCYRADDIAVMLDIAAEFGYHIAAVHHATEAYKIVDRLREADVCAAVWSDWWGFKREAEDGIRENAAFVDAAGGCALMHSDIPLLADRLNVEAGKAAAAGRRAGLTLPVEHAIRWLTSNPARVLGLADRIGTIAVGRNADLVLWSGEPLSVYAQADQVFIDGALVFDRHDPARQAQPDFLLGRPAIEAAR